MSLFMAFILVLSAMMIRGNEKDTLIENDYYEKGKTFDKDYKARQAALKDHVELKIISGPSGVSFLFPVEAKYHMICRRLSDYKLDTTMTGVASAAHPIQFRKGEIKAGSWKVRIEYSLDDNIYLFEDEIKMP